MFYYRTNFSKKVVFLEKTVKNTFVGGHDRFEGRGAPDDKNQYNFFCRHRRFEYVSSNNFFEKKQCSPKYKRKIIFAGVTIFEGTGVRTTKMNITFFLVNGVPNTVFKFFLKKPHTAWLLCNTFNVLCQNIHSHTQQKMSRESNEGFLLRSWNHRCASANCCLLFAMFLL